MCLDKRLTINSKYKIQAAKRLQSNSLVPLFKLRDLVAKVKLQVYHSLDVSRAVAVQDSDSEACHSSWEDEDIPALFKPLLNPLQVAIKSEVEDLDLNDQDLDPITVRVIQERVMAKLDENKKHACRSLNTYHGLFMNIYSLLSTLANVTSDSVCVYFKFSSVEIG